MIPAPFEYERAGSLEQAIQLLGQREDARILAGGHSLIPLMRFRLARPSTLVDIARIDELSYIRKDGGEIAIGALTRHRDVERSELLREACPIVPFAASGIGDPQVRNVGTIGGSVAHADPAGDLGPVLLAIGARFVIRGPGGSSRTVPAGGFFRGLFETDLARDEILTEIRVPELGRRGWSYLKFHRRAIDWALVGVAAVTGSDGGPFTVTLTNMADRPIHAAGVEEALAAGADPVAAAGRAAEGTSPPSDSFASAEYRQELAKVITRRALEEALSGSGL